MVVLAVLVETFDSFETGGDSIDYIQNLTATKHDLKKKKGWSVILFLHLPYLSKGCLSWPGH